MTKPLVDGFCEPEFSKLEDIFVKSIQSGFDDGAGFALEVEGKEVLNLWGGFSDREHKKNWQENTLVNVFSVTKAMTLPTSVWSSKMARLWSTARTKVPSTWA